METNQFHGFPEACFKFYLELAQHNERAWFNEHKAQFEASVMTPARDFVEAMGIRLQEIVPGVVADPRVDRSIFRIYRDVRFSRDKSPFKTQLALWWWQGSRARMENSGFYFQLQPPDLMLGVGIYRFPDNLLESYRQAVIDPQYGAALQHAIQQVHQHGNYTVGGQYYKKVPRGYDPDHPNASLLLHNGLYTGFEIPVPDLLYTPELVDFCFDRFNEMLPLHTWLVQFTEQFAEISG